MCQWRILHVKVRLDTKEEYVYELDDHEPTSDSEYLRHKNELDDIAGAEPVQSRCRADGGLMEGRCRADAEPIQGRCRADAGPM